METVRPHATNETDVTEHKLFYSMSKPVPLLNSQGGESNGQSVISCRSFSLSSGSLESSDMFKANLMPSSSHRSLEHNNSLDFGTSAQQDKPG